MDDITPPRRAGCCGARCDVHQLYTLFILETTADTPNFLLAGSAGNLGLELLMRRAHGWPLVCCLEKLLTIKFTELTVARNI